MLTELQQQYVDRLNQLARRHMFALAIQRDEAVPVQHRARAKKLKNKINNAVGFYKREYSSKNKWITKRETKRETKLINITKATVQPLKLTRTDGLPIRLIGNVVIGEVPFHLLKELYGDHHRIEVFLSKGMQCVHPGCDKVATRAILTAGMRRSGKTGKPSYHLDLFTNDLKHMNVDHIIPLSKKGPDTLDNKQPMCAKHNSAKGSKIIPF